MLVDYHIHCIAHGDRQSNRENYLEYIAEARNKKIRQIGFAEHNEYLNDVDYNVLLALKEETKDVEIKVGVEMEMPSEENAFKELKSYPLDYVIASIHVLDDWMFDHPDYQDRYKQLDNSVLYSKYFNKMAQLLDWQGYNIIGHMDLIKIFNKRSELNYKPLIERGLKNLRNRPCAVEINTAGFYKPIGEIYPSVDIIRWMYEIDVPITLSSDAHIARDVGRDIAKTLELVRKIGYRKIATFTRGERILEAI